MEAESYYASIENFRLRQIFLFPKKLFVPNNINLCVLEILVRLSYSG